ncbi:BlaR1 family beta-lactam sensor/signal transducer [Anaerocolumna sedimenticola]|uniref:BlaR1 family beta-lactam sensor/signal transducer n=1 Tax=Anaerocolumna sedimenticola TaxID=2696063 RepID=A0A6P1THP2_9FIRM|nr:BlaR1 family beta-lactam sensor/signal transducer [Anaerocolumna sedimenticola]QHQ59456.1 BlaR1 family beta-lactam sensor/signal transducer [Anaerocolumna sedimenticola]
MLPSFGIHFIITNITISLLILAIILIKKGLKKHISIRVHYNIWFLFLIMLVIPLIPVKSTGLSHIGALLSYLDTANSQGNSPIIPEGVPTDTAAGVNWFRDLSVSVDRTSPSLFNTCLIVFWLTGCCIMLFFTIRSSLRIRKLIHSSLPVQNQRVKLLLRECKEKAEIKKDIPVLSSAFLKSPISIGIFHPKIILPIHLISDFNETEIRYILLHELQHYRHKDIPINYIMCFARIFYWYQPFVWYALKEMRNDRELACDTSVLYLLDEESYVDYGTTLIRFAGKVSCPSFPFATGLGGTKKQITKRIINITSFNPESGWLKVKSILIFAITCSIILVCTPILSINAAPDTTYGFSETNIDYEDLSSYFKQYNGSFVLYNLNSDNWTIYNESKSLKRISPDSTYKIYSALFGLENGTITPEASVLPWDKINYPYESWNKEQNLDSAIKNSVNWYFQALDQKTGKQALQKYINQINYGNENLSGGISRFWLESSLKISPVEQVELLTKFYQNDFHFKDSNIKAVKNALLISQSSGNVLYGKTGTGNIENNNVNGWFVGFIEKSGNTYFFATNIQGEDNTDGTNARNITLEILKAKQLYQTE